MIDLKVQGLAHGLPAGFPEIPLNWRTEWKTAPSSDGKLNLFSVQHSRLELPPDESAPVVKILFVFHGQGEHCGRYLHFPHYLSEVIDVVATMDHRGHGRSEGVRGHVERFDLYVQDARQFVERVCQQWCSRGAKVQAHLFGHSMGGLISLLLAQEHPELGFQSATFSAPLLGLNFKVPFPKRVAGHALSRVLGAVQLDTGLDPALISHDPQVVKAYTSDRLVHGKATARFFTELQRSMKKAFSRDFIQAATQFIVPLADGVVDAQRALSYAAQLKQPGKRTRTYEGFFHESFNEVQKDKAFSDLKSWIKEHS